MSKPQGLAPYRVRVERQRLVTEVGYVTIHALNRLDARKSAGLLEPPAMHQVSSTEKRRTCTPKRMD